MQVRKPKLLFLVTEDYYFWSHRLSLAKAAQSKGFEVTVATHVSSHGERVQQAGFTLIPTLFSRNNTNLFHQMRALFELIKIFRRVRPDVVHNVALKAIVFGSISAFFVPKARVINLVAGFGTVFTSEQKKHRVMASIGRLMARLLLQRSRVTVIVQNQDDYHAVGKMAPRASLRLVRGSGVDTQAYVPFEEPAGLVRVTLVGRMLWNKGIRELIEASRLLKLWDEKIQFQLVGGIDPGSSESIPEHQLYQWQDEGLANWLGHQSDIARIWKGSHIAVLPSYREGLPKSLLEAAACGRPIVTSDAPGCREIVQDGFNGILTPVKDAEKLALAIRHLARDPMLRKTMGQNGRELVCQEFSEECVNSQMFLMYQ